MCTLVTGRNEGQGYVFTRVCHSVNRRGVCLSACWGTTPTQEQKPPRSTHPLLSRHPPPEQALPQSRHPSRWSRQPPRADPPGSRLRHTVNERPVRILLECILVTLVCVIASKCTKFTYSIENTKSKITNTRYHYFVS